MKSIQQFLRVFPLALSLSLSLTSLAYADANLRAISQHGGAMVETASGVILEMAPRDNALYLYEHSGKPLSVEGASGKLVVTGGNGPIVLTPAGGNRLNLAEPLPAGAKAVVSITLPGKAPIQSRLEPAH